MLINFDMATYAFCLGVNNYLSPLSSLRYAERDAMDMAALLKHKFGFVAKYLEERKAEDIVAQLKNLEPTLQAGDDFIFYFSGHGKAHPSGQYYFLPGCQYCEWDVSTPVVVGMLSKTMLEEFTSVGNWRGVNRLFIFDACRAHLELGKSVAGYPTFRGGATFRHAFGPHKTKKKSNDSGKVVILNSCDDGMVAAELPGLEHGVFTAALIAHLEEVANAEQDIVLDDEVVAVLARRMISLSEQFGYTNLNQRPALSATARLTYKLPRGLSPQERTDFAEFLVLMGHKYYYGRGVEADSEKAEEYYQRAKLYDEEVLIGSISNVTGMPLQYEEPSNTADMQADASHIAAGIAHRYVHGSRFSDIPTEQFSPQMVCIRPGRFLLGSPEHPAAPATRQYQLRRPLAVGVYPITVAQFRAMAPIAEVFRVGSAFKIFFADALPMTNIDWWQANQFCQALTAHVNAARQKAGLKKLAIADQYRLPTDDEWETFARAGGTTAYSFAPLQAPPCGYTDSPDPNWAYYDWRKSLGGSMIKPHHPTIPGEVGSIEPNFWGVCGCHGNVWEWTALRHDGQDLASLRGGYFKSPPGEILSSTVRLQTINYSQLGMIGFRLVRNLSDDEWGE